MWLHFCMWHFQSKESNVIISDSRQRDHVSRTKKQMWGINEVFVQLFFFFPFFFLPLNLKKYYLFTLKKKKLLSGFAYSAPIDKPFMSTMTKILPRLWEVYSDLVWKKPWNIYSFCQACNAIVTNRPQGSAKHVIYCSIETVWPDQVLKWQIQAFLKPLNPSS